MILEPRISGPDVHDCEAKMRGKYDVCRVESMVRNILTTRSGNGEKWRPYVEYCVIEIHVNENMSRIISWYFA